MFLELDQKEKNRIAAIDDTDSQITYGELCEFSENFGDVVPKRTVIFCLCENSIGALAGYIACQSNYIVPLLIGKTMNHQLLNKLIDIYQPSYLWVPQNSSNSFCMPAVYKKYGYCLLETKYKPYEVNTNLSLLLTTSGSTGSPKLVRYKYGNLEANARNVANGFGWTKAERGIVDLPMHYTMGLNVINTHLLVGATVILTDYNIMSVEFWKLLKEKEVTNLTGVPLSYELFFKLRFHRMDLPHLKTMAQGGGKLTNKLFMEFAEYANKVKKRFIATFGTTETSARMSYLPPNMALSKCGSIGKAFAEGELFILDEVGNEILGDDVEGELGYRGPNVTMGYAQCRDDLLLGDIWNGEYHTGDIARRDKDGCYYIVGRLSRFLKLSGYRISLDQCENLIKTEFNTECACTGTDEKMRIYITSKSIEADVLKFISEKTGIYKSLFEVNTVDALSKNEAGKVLYRDLDRNDINQQLK